MNKRVMQALIILLWLFFILFAVLKIFFGDIFLVFVNNEKFLWLGAVIDSSLPLQFITDVLVSFVLMHFYLCACLKQWRLSLYKYLLFLYYVVFLRYLYLLSTPVASVVDIGAMLVLPFVLGCEKKHSAVVFISHQIGQLFTLFIRSEPVYMASTNYVTQFVVFADMYIWMAIYYIYSNLYKEETLWAFLLHPFSAIRRRRS